jgi:glycosyltransferase involved in cell wall biosynthesis
MGDVNSSVERKNLIGAVDAFRRTSTTEKRLRLTIKTQNVLVGSEPHARLMKACAEDDRIELIDRTMSREEIVALLSRSHCFMSLHRSEGFGLVLAEAMQLGTPVVTTAWSGNTDFMNAEVASLVPSQLVPVADPQKIYQHQVWAEPDLDAAADHLSRLVHDPAYWHTLSKDGALYVRRGLGIEAYRSIIEPRLGKPL